MTTRSRRRPPAPRERGGAALHLAGGLAVLAMVVGAGFFAVTQAVRDSEPDPDEITHVACTPGKELTGPQVDLGIQTATGNRARPFLSTAEVDELVGLAEKAGAKVISTSVSFRSLKPRKGAAYRYAGLDRFLSAVDAAGLDVRLQLIGMPDWALDEPTGKEYQPPVSRREREQWSQFVADLMHHLDSVEADVRYVEVWPEPNGTQFWSTGPDPLAFVRLLEATRLTLDRVAPGTTLISGGLNGNDIGFLQRVYQASDDLGLAKRPFDLVGVHPYNGDTAPDVVDPSLTYTREPFGSVDENFTGFRALHDVMVGHGDDDLGIYLTQFGYSTRGHDGVSAVPDDVRARYLTDAFRAATCSSYVTGLSWYYLHPTPWDPPRWTLLDRNLRPNQTYDALAAWSETVTQVAS